jgi:hypothetical protein
MDTLHNVPSYVKVDPYGRVTDVNVVAGASTVAVRAVAGDTLDFYFPKGYIDLSTLAMYFRYFCLPYSVAKSGTAQSLPKDTECMIQTLEVYLGGKRVNWIQNYNQMFFLWSLYGADAEFRANRDAVLNMHTNGRASQVADLDGVQFCIEKWLGILGLPIVLDTHKWGQLVVKVTLAGPHITTSNSTLHSYGLSDVYMRVKYLENYNGETPSYLEFDDFKSIMNREPNYNQKTTLTVNSSRIDYALGRILRFDAFNKGNGFAIGAGTVTTFGTTVDGNNVRTWNFSVNNNNVFRYNPSVAEGVKTVLDLMHSKSINTNTQVTNGFPNFDRQWVCGAELGFINEYPVQAEIGFLTESSTSVPGFALLIVKTTSSLEMDKDGNIVHLV